MYESGRGRFLVIAAGGTGGHMFPAQALSQEMLRRGWRVSLSTDDRGLRYAGGFPPEVERREVQSATFARGGIAEKMRAPFTILSGANEAIAWFKKEKPDLVAGFGGYPSLPALGAAWRLGLPRMIQEQNSVLGRVNALFAKRVHAVACGVEHISNAPLGANLHFIGNPIRDAGRALSGSPYHPIDENGPIRLLVFGGSQGARIFDERVPAAVAALPAEIRDRLLLTQQVREADQNEVREGYRRAGVLAELAPFFDDMPQRVAGAHLVVCRAGASTIAELTAIGRPSVLAPYPAAMNDHQTHNAHGLVDAGAAVMLPDAEMSVERLTAQLTELLNDPARLTKMAAAARGLGAPNAASDLADLAERVANGEDVAAA
ncbi:MAG: undecaprenyldiphospho-muramoylpentapeptide beta-N-acetylglucosaminyltransferase [Pseudomonadota bacterium]